MLLVAHVKPNAKKTEVIGHYFEGTVTIALHAPATEGKANEELIAFLSDTLRVAKTALSIRSGARSRMKRVVLPDGTDLSPLHP